MNTLLNRTGCFAQMNRTNVDELDVSHMMLSWTKKFRGEIVNTAVYLDNRPIARIASVSKGKT